MPLMMKREREREFSGNERGNITQPCLNYNSAKFSRNQTVDHCAGINCLDVLNSSVSSDKSYLFTGSRDDTQEMGI
ncbi:hypothetical protein YC2023_013408 [Brassica napus]